MIHELEMEVCGVECIVKLYDWEPYKPAYITGAPENCYEAEGGYGNWEIFIDGERAEWLEKKMSKMDIERVDETLFEMMEGA